MLCISIGTVRPGEATSLFYAILVLGLLLILSVADPMQKFLPDKQAMYDVHLVNPSL